MEFACGKVNSTTSAGPQILALGSCHGDDRVAWQVADNLAKEPNLQGRVCKVGSPFELVEILQAGRPTILVDACRTGCVPGTVMRIREDQLASIAGWACSTHGATLVDALQLADSLGRKPHCLVILAVEIESSSPGSDLTESARRGVRLLEERVRAEISELTTSGGECA